MFDPITLAVGGALVAAGWSAGRATRRREQRRETQSPVCGCTHGLHYHDEHGRCHASIEREKKWDEAGEPIEYQYVPCPCQQYIGPTPIDQIYVPPIMPPTP